MVGEPERLNYTQVIRCGRLGTRPIEFEHPDLLPSGIDVRDLGSGPLTKKVVRADDDVPDAQGARRTVRSCW
jgi:hypothetical protein